MGVKRRLEVHVDRLVLHGFDPADREPVGEALRLELSGLLTEHELPPALTQRSRRFREAPRQSMPPTVQRRAPASGRDIARAVYRALGEVGS